MKQNLQQKLIISRHKKERHFVNIHFLSELLTNHLPVSVDKHVLYVYIWRLIMYFHFCFADKTKNVLRI